PPRHASRRKSALSDKSNCTLVEEEPSIYYLPHINYEYALRYGYTIPTLNSPTDTVQWPELDESDDEDAIYERHQERIHSSGRHRNALTQLTCATSQPKGRFGKSLATTSITTESLKVKLKKIWHFFKPSPSITIQQISSAVVH
ncbi:hypothetical protein EV182_006483, partial [Spiromyces aspiralis]